MKLIILILTASLAGCNPTVYPPGPETGETLNKCLRSDVAETNEHFTKYVIYLNGDTYFVTCSKEHQILSVWSTKNNPYSE